MRSLQFPDVSLYLYAYFLAGPLEEANVLIFPPSQPEDCCEVLSQASKPRNAVTDDEQRKGILTLADVVTYKKTDVEQAGMGDCANTMKLKN
ncbi:hypothetical protein LshimejAT787_0110000 [Lyophyllum shimeji]|uniref:Uncharacterized protein n=1 Tax=Lyophyllum shimeji TaxID=47721 RepID=A0A9P3PDY3_LYOSH|nr:hypothetical protein LshimejAT787_0110000 [Lyophyllum shimeji]